MEEGALTNFTVTMKMLFHMQLCGDLTFAELTTYQWLCFLADKKGFAHVPSYEFLSALIPLDFKANTLGVIIRSLRDHGLIDFLDHQGKRKGFKIIVGFWPIGKNKCRILKNFLKKHGDLLIDIYPIRSQVDEEDREVNHKLDRPKKTVNTGFLTQSDESPITSSYIESKRQNENVDISNSTNKKRCIPTSGFIPASSEHEKLVFIANLCGDQCMNYLLGIYGKYGAQLIPILDRCELKFKEANLKRIENRQAFMTWLIQLELKELLL